MSECDRILEILDKKIEKTNKGEYIAILESFKDIVLQVKNEHIQQLKEQRKKEKNKLIKKPKVEIKHEESKITKEQFKKPSGLIREDLGNGTVRYYTIK